MAFLQNMPPICFLPLVKKSLKALKRNLLKRAIPLVGVGVCCFPTWAFQTQGPLSLALGGAGRAATKEAEYHLLNPASLMSHTGFSGSIFYNFAVDQNKPYWGGSFKENRRIPLALSYIKERETEQQYLQFSTAGLILPGWSLGISASWWKENSTSDEWNIQAGLLINPPQTRFSLGFVWDYILPLKGPFKNKRTYGVGVAYAPYKWLNLIADALYNPHTKWMLAGGGEITLSKFLVLRAGSRWEKENSSFRFSGGVSLKAQTMALDWSVSQIQTPTSTQNKWLNTLSFRGSF